MSDEQAARLLAREYEAEFGYDPEEALVRARNSPCSIRAIKAAYEVGGSWGRLICQ